MSTTDISSAQTTAALTTTADPAQAVAHLTPEHWERANRHLVRKALAEFAHERLIDPVDLGSGRYRVSSDDGATEYLFAPTCSRSTTGGSTRRASCAAASRAAGPCRSTPSTSSSSCGTG